MSGPRPRCSCCLWRQTGAAPEEAAKVIIPPLFILASLPLLAPPPPPPPPHCPSCPRCCTRWQAGAAVLVSACHSLAPLLPRPHPAPRAPLAPLPPRPLSLSLPLLLPLAPLPGRGSAPAPAVSRAAPPALHSQRGALNVMKQAGRQVGGRAGRRAGRQAGKQQAGSCSAVFTCRAHPTLSCRVSCLRPLPLNQSNCAKVGCPAYCMVGRSVPIPTAA